MDRGVTRPSRRWAAVPDACAPQRAAACGQRPRASSAACLAGLREHRGRRGSGAGCREPQPRLDVPGHGDDGARAEVLLEQLGALESAVRGRVASPASARRRAARAPAKEPPSRDRRGLHEALRRSAEAVAQPCVEHHELATSRRAPASRRAARPGPARRRRTRDWVLGQAGRAPSTPPASAARGRRPSARAAGVDGHRVEAAHRRTAGLGPCAGPLCRRARGRARRIPALRDRRDVGRRRQRLAEVGAGFVQHLERRRRAPTWATSAWTARRSPPTSPGAPGAP